MSEQKRPDISVTADDHEELIGLALQALGRAPGAALLLQEMERAKVVDDVPANVLAMNVSGNRMANAMPCTPSGVATRLPSSTPIQIMANENATISR